MCMWKRIHAHPPKNCDTHTGSAYMRTCVYVYGSWFASALILRAVHMCRSCHYFTPIVTGSAALKRIRAPGIDRRSSIIDVHHTSAAELAVRRAGYRWWNSCLFRGQKIFSVPSMARARVCNSRTDGRFCSVNRIRRGNSLRSFFNYSARGKKRRCIVAPGIKRRAVTRESRKNRWHGCPIEYRGLIKRRLERADRFSPIERCNERELYFRK